MLDAHALEAVLISRGVRAAARRQVASACELVPLLLSGDARPLSLIAAGQVPTAKQEALRVRLIADLEVVTLRWAAFSDALLGFLRRESWATPAVLAATAGAVHAAFAAMTEAGSRSKLAEDLIRN